MRSQITKFLTPAVAIHALCLSILVAAAIMTLPRPVAAQKCQRVCMCSDSYCQDSGGSSFLRWCCNVCDGQANGCGCSLFTNC